MVTLLLIVMHLQVVLMSSLPSVPQVLHGPMKFLSGSLMSIIPDGHVTCKPDPVKKALLKMPAPKLLDDSAIISQTPVLAGPGADSWFYSSQ